MKDLEDRTVFLGVAPDLREYAKYERSYVKLCIPEIIPLTEAHFKVIFDLLLTDQRAIAILRLRRQALMAFDYRSNLSGCKKYFYDCNGHSL